MRFLAALAILPAVALSGSAGAQTGSAPSQAGRFAGRVRVVGRCGFLGCSWRAL